MKNQQAQVFPEMGLNQDILYMPIPPPKVRYYSARAVRSNPQRWKFPKSKQSLPIPAEKYGDSRNHRSVAMARLNFILFLNFFSHLESWFPMVPHGSPWFPMVPHGSPWFRMVPWTHWQSLRAGDDHRTIFRRCQTSSTLDFQAWYVLPPGRTLVITPWLMKIPWYPWYPMSYWLRSMKILSFFRFVVGSIATLSAQLSPASWHPAAGTFCIFLPRLSKAEQLSGWISVARISICQKIDPPWSTQIRPKTLAEKSF